MTKQRFTLTCYIGLLCLITIDIAWSAVVSRGRGQGYSHHSSEETDSEHSSRNETQTDDVCRTQFCQETAARIKAAMDTTVDPCDDFYEYACGTWNREHDIPEDASSYTTFTKLREELTDILKNLLEEPDQEDDITAIRYAKNAYRSCLNTSVIEDRLTQPLLDMLASYGGWPVLDPDWDEASFDITATLAVMSLTNRGSLFSFKVSGDLMDSSSNVIVISGPYLGLPSREYFLRPGLERVRTLYQNCAIDVAVLLGANRTTAESDMAEAILFETAIANITTPAEEMRNLNAVYSKVNVSDLRNMTQGIDLRRFVDLLFANVSKTVDDTDGVVLYTMGYLPLLGELIARTPKRIVANYIVWNMIQNNIERLPRAFLDTGRNLIKALTGRDREKPRSDKCVEFTVKSFALAVGKLYVDEHFDANAKTNAEEMVEHLKSAFSILLDEVPWMDNITRNQARVKVNEMEVKVGYNDQINNVTFLNEEYREAVMQPDRYFENYQTWYHAMLRNMLRIHGEPVDKTRWGRGPAVINAFNKVTMNQILFPAGILQPPMYHGRNPKSLNYGGIGMIIGHEITHGYDDRGRLFDEEGNLRDWWTDTVAERFTEKAQCIINQYSNYTVPEVNMQLNGINTQGENIADNGGLKQAFKAYRTWVAEQGHEEPGLPGLHLTHNQLFFLTFAQIWCGTTRTARHRLEIITSPHSTGRFRVIGPLSNLQEFSEAWGCPLNSRMNPSHKCSVW